MPEHSRLTATGRAPMPVRYWSRAGIMLTDWCNASCACCYANCLPGLSSDMAAGAAVDIWRQLAQFSPHGCRVHLTGGEVFGRLDLLMDVCRKAAEQRLGEIGGVLEFVETNAFWARDEGYVREILAQLDSFGMQKLSISCDPYHQQYVPIENCRLLVRVAEDVLGPGRARLKIRWEDWLDEGFDLADWEPQKCREFLMEYASGGRERFTGRAADGLDDMADKYPAEYFRENPCRGALLRGKHVHIAPTGEVWPATCVGISIGNALTEPISEIWQRLSDNFRQTPLISDLAEAGPVSIMDQAMALGYVPRRDGYASKCQLCFDLRRFLHCKDPSNGYLGPSGIYSLPKRPSG